MKKTIILFMSLLMIMTASCKKETITQMTDVPRTDITSSRELQVPSDFTWSTTKRIDVNLEFVTKNQIPANNANIMIYAGTKETKKNDF